jgi:hypothetical protein
MGFTTGPRLKFLRGLFMGLAPPTGFDPGAHAPSPLPTALANALQQLPELEQATIALSLERVVNLLEENNIELVSTAALGVAPGGT